MYIINSYNFFLSVRLFRKKSMRQGNAQFMPLNHSSCACIAKSDLTYERDPFFPRFFFISQFSCHLHFLLALSRIAPSIDL